jgi:hypothetical protein
MPPFFTASTTCNKSLPVDIDPSFLNADFEYQRENCVTQFFLNGSSTQKLPVTFDTPTTSTSTPVIASSSDFYVDPVFTGGEIIIIFLMILMIPLIFIQLVANSLSGIKTKKTYIGYSGGDVEVRDDN